MSSKRVKEIHDKINAMPLFSQVADRALSAERDRSLDGSLDERGFHHPGLARQILQMTNLTSYGFSGNRAGSFESDAIESGNVIRSMMLGFSLQDFIGKELPAYGFAENELWEHVMNCGISTWMIASKVGYADLETAFVAGMMHDIGKVILNEFLAEESGNVVDTISQEDETIVHAERKILGIDHAEAGALLAKHWAFDEKIIEAIRYHHQPEKAEIDPDLTALVHLADCVSLSIRQAVSSNDLANLLMGDFSGLPQST
ncbi:MAG TPA: HDOD domain-containing protein [Candidatus Aquicultor sp.]|jgi:putative nucleotidyltransferase with HDIG domain